MTSNHRKSSLAAKLRDFVGQYGRRAQKGVDPNDRGYSRKIEDLAKRMPPEDLSELLSGDSMEVVPPVRTKKPVPPDLFRKKTNRHD